MDLALVSTQTGWGGGECLLAQLALGLRGLGVRVELAAPAGSATHEWADREGVDCLPLLGRGRSPVGMWRLRRWVQQRGFQGVVLNDPHAITYGGAALSGTGPVRVGIKHTCFPVRSAWKHNHLVDHVVCVAEAARGECLTAGVSPERLEVIHAGLDPFDPPATEVEEARRLFAARGRETKNVLAIGSLLPVKGFDILIDALESSSGWDLWIAGEGPEREALEAQIQRLGVADRVTLLGFRTDIGALLMAADAFASASHREGLSLVLVEAMLAGTPVVATPVGGNGEALQINQPGESPVARAVAPGDAVGLAAAIGASLESTEANASRIVTARQWAEEHFTVDRMTRDYLATFERLLARPAGCRAA